MENYAFREESEEMQEIDGEMKKKKGKLVKPLPRKRFKIPKWGSKKDQEGKKALLKRSMYNVTEHLMSPEDMVAKLETNVDFNDPYKSKGMLMTAARDRLVTEGKNELTPPKQTPEIVKFLLQFTNFFMLLLTLAGVLSIIAYFIDRDQQLNLWLGIVLFFIVVLTCVMSYVQERASSNVMGTFKTMLASETKVIRNGKEHRIPTGEVVRGDVVMLRTGDKIPADIRLLAVSGLKVEQAALTGESDAIECSLKSHENPLDSTNLVFNSCLCIEGEGIGVVIRTGDHTLIGTIASATSAATAVETTLQKEVKRFVRFIAVLAFIMAIIFFIIGVAQGQNVINTFVNGFIVVIVANVPQGLPATVTSCLTITTRRMAKKNVFVKRLDSVETLGSASVIATDKTGTLTENRMTVENFWFDEEWVPSRDTFAVDNEYSDSPVFEILFKIAALCNRAKFEGEDETVTMEDELREMDVKVMGMSPSLRSPSLDIRKSVENRLPKKSVDFARLDVEPTLEGRRPSLDIRKSMDIKKSMERKKKVQLKRDSIIGDASEAALLWYCSQLKNVDRIRNENPKIFEIPFNSKNKWQLSVHRREGMNDLLVIKGAPEILLSKCSQYITKGGLQDIDEGFKKRFQKAYERFGSMGERVLGLAHLELDPKKFPPTPDTIYTKESVPMEGFCFTGLVSLIDPPRKGVPEAVEKCKTAGIRVVMVTGDHPLTAEAIARKVGILGDFETRKEVAQRLKISEDEVDEEDVQAEVIYGPHMNDFEEEDWDRILAKPQLVFARTSPLQKVLIVENCQRLGEIVAVTGDGVNDAIALKKADIGVAMGQTGSEVAREAADAILTDDNFASIVLGVQEGRVLFDNLKKTIAYTLSHLWPEVMPVLLNLAIGLPPGLSPLLILSIDLGTELAPAISLAYEKMESDIMDRPPRDPKSDRLVSFPLLSYSYLQAGIVEALVCIGAYLGVFAYHGIPLSSLPFSTDYWKVGAPDLVFDGRVYTADEQLDILYESNATWFLNLVMIQVAHIWMCKTRFLSLFQHGIRNMVCNYGVIIEIAIMIIIVYVPFLQPFIGTAPVRAIFWTPWVGGAVILWVWGEGRKLYTRRHPDSKFARYFAW